MTNWPDCVECLVYTSTRRVVWNKWRKWDVLEEELLNFGHSQHDDAVDSMVLTMGGLIEKREICN